MVAAVELYFDHVAERRIRVLWDALRPPAYPACADCSTGGTGRTGVVGAAPHGVMRVPRPVLTESLRLCLETLPIEATLRSAAIADHARGVLAPL